MIAAGAQIFKMAAWRFVDVSEEEINTMKENAIPKGTKDAAKSRMTFSGRKDMDVLLIVIKNLANRSGDVVDVPDTNISRKMFFI